MYCLNCGSKIEKRDKYCPKCGKIKKINFLELLKNMVILNKKIILTIISILIIIFIASWITKLYKLNQIKTAEKEQNAEEMQKQKDLEVDKLKEEVEILKNLKPEIITKTIDNTEKDINLPSIISKWTPRIAKINCKYVVPDNMISRLQSMGINTSPQYGSGSGFLTETYDTTLKENVITVTTNDHVISGHNGFSYAESCVVNLGSYTYIVNSNVNSVNYEDIRSFSKNPKTEKINDEWYLFPEIDAASIIIRNPDPEIKKLAHSNPICPTNPSIGESIVVLGFPSVGSQNGITATEGIISGLEDGYYVTSAKVEHGNSGGAAFWLKNNCYIGIPSYALTGTVESLARILNIKNVFERW